MDRRRFIKNISATSGASLMLSGIPINLLAGNNQLKNLAATSTNDKVLVFIQMHGGNDALNTIVPLFQYDQYYHLRENIALPDFGNRSLVDLDPSVSDEKRIGLHPDLKDLKAMYDDKMLSIVQNVGYPNMNLSHFRGRDIMFMGVGSDDNDTTSGWIGRYLDSVYPNYPEDYKGADDDPIGLEFSGVQSLAFHRDDGIPMGFNIYNPEHFYQLINGLDLENLDDLVTFPDSYAGEELKYLMDFETTSDFYSQRLKEAYDKGNMSNAHEYRTDYPFSAGGSNPLAPQLQIIARLLGGGIKTKVFLCRIGGFDTHEGQVEPYDTTLGNHSWLMYYFGTAMKDFYDDLKKRGIEDRVLSLTTTEFGRRAFSNESYGTDHGTTSPVFIFGPGANAGIKNNCPDLNAAINTGNLPYEGDDYRYIYGSIAKNWLEASDNALEAAKFSAFTSDPYGLFDLTTVNETPYGQRKPMAYPNPATNFTRLQFYLNTNKLFKVYIYNTQGKVVHQESGYGKYGLNAVGISLDQLSTGIYQVVVQGSATRQSLSLIVQ